MSKSSQRTRVPLAPMLTYFLQDHWIRITDFCEMKLLAAKGTSRGQVLKMEQAELLHRLGREKNVIARIIRVEI